MQSVAIITLGCPKNQVDSEIIRGLLSKKGYSETKDQKRADIIIINTCGFIRDAKEESINALLEAAVYKTEGNCTLLIASGCLTQRYGEEIFNEMPEIDIVLGTTSFPRIAEAIEAFDRERKRVLDIGHRDTIVPEGLPRVIPKGVHYEYLKIAEGCNNHCSYCIIPKLRGRYKSRREGDIIKEAKAISATNGGDVKELILIAQDTTGYGKDLYNELRLPQLLRKLCTVEGIDWIRLLYCYPDNITKELIDTVKSNSKICKYLDIPIQHASDKVLRAMNRKMTAARTEALLYSIKERIPEVAIRSTIIVGFPGEEDRDFEKVKNLVKGGYFDRLGVFVYSREWGTPSYDMQGHVPRALAEERKGILMLEQQKISLRNNASLIGQNIEVIVDGRDHFRYYGRTYRDAPDIDNLVTFSSEKPLKMGGFITIKVEHVLEYELVGSVVR